MTSVDRPLAQTVPPTVVFGADGFIGGHLLARLQRDNPLCQGVGHRPAAGRCCLDLADPDIRPLELKARGITHAVIAAGISQVALCEREPLRTRSVNVTGTIALAKQLRGEGIRVVALSSDYVFDGAAGDYAEASAINPLNEYGRQKAAMENGLLHGIGGDLLVIRLSKVFSLERGSGTLLDEMAGRLLRGLPVRAARDQYFCPTLIDDVVTGVLQLLTSPLTGNVHLCAPSRISRLQLAVKVAAAFGCNPALVEEISLQDLNEGFLRPLDSSMICTRLDFMPPYSCAGLDACLIRMKEIYELSEAARG